MTSSDLSPALIAAYRATEYRVGSGGLAFTLRIDARSEPLARLYAASGSRCAAFISASNPHSRRQSGQANLAAHVRLRDALIELACPVFEGVGADPSGAWPGEQSLLVLGLEREAAKAIGTRFSQNAIVWAGEDAIPKLILLTAGREMNACAAYNSPMRSVTTTAQYKTDDVRIRAIEELVAPSALLREYPLSLDAANAVSYTRHAIHRILHGAEDRLVIVIGPCSIHDVKAAREYAGRLLDVKKRLAGDLLIAMRVYFEKPRTTVGWKGLINDPDLDGSFRINDGLRVARELLLHLNDMGMPVGCEFLDMITPQYIGDLISWGAIGARTTESQVHRELASGLSCPVGFKNGTDGSIRIAVDAIRAARSPHHFMGVTKGGHSAIVSTTGNEDCHVVLRGGKAPNYDAASVNAASKALGEAGLAQKLMIDLSHSNSSKQYEKQVEVAMDVARQIAAGDERIAGIMAESHLREGRQDLVKGKPLVYGQSITDACIGWDDTQRLLEALADAVRTRRLRKAQEY